MINYYHIPCAALPINPIYVHFLNFTLSISSDGSSLWSRSELSFIATHDRCFPFPGFSNQLLIDSQYQHAKSIDVKIKDDTCCRIISNRSSVSCLAMSWLTVLRTWAFYWRILMYWLRNHVFHFLWYLKNWLSNFWHSSKLAIGDHTQNMLYHVFFVFFDKLICKKTFFIRKCMIGWPCIMEWSTITLQPLMLQ